MVLNAPSVQFLYSHILRIICTTLRHTRHNNKKSLEVSILITPYVTFFARVVQVVDRCKLPLAAERFAELGECRSGCVSGTLRSRLRCYQQENNLGLCHEEDAACLLRHRDCEHSQEKTSLSSRRQPLSDTGRDDELVLAANKTVMLSVNCDERENNTF